MRICIDPGHGMSNKRSGVPDSGAEAAGVQEATVAMLWANALKHTLEEMGHIVIRTRVDDRDPCPVSRRDDIARSYRCNRMLSIHCNAADGKANGTEVFYRGSDDKPLAEALCAAVCESLGTKSRGAKTESQSQHSALAVLDFDKCWLLELGFIDHKGDRAKMLNAALMQAACARIAKVLTDPYILTPL